MTVQFAITIQWWVMVGLTAEISSELVEGLERADVSTHIPCER